MFNKRFWNFSGIYGVLAVATVPLILEMVPPNRWYGFRLPGAMTQPQLWYALNRHGGLMMLIAMVVCALLNGLVFWIGGELLVKIAGWINGGLILLSFWLITLELLGQLP